MRLAFPTLGFRPLGFLRLLRVPRPPLELKGGAGTADPHHRPVQEAPRPRPGQGGTRLHLLHSKPEADLLESF